MNQNLCFLLVFLAMLAQPAYAQKRSKPKTESTKRAKNQPITRAKSPQINISKDQKLRDRSPIEPTETDQSLNLPKFEMRRMKGTDLLQKTQQAKVPPQLKNEQRLLSQEMSLRRKTTQDYGQQLMTLEQDKSILQKEKRSSKVFSDVVAGIVKTHRESRKAIKTDWIQSDFQGNLVRRKHENNDQIRADIATNFRLDYNFKINKKDLHPSAAYLSSHFVNSFYQKEVMRIKSLERSQRQIHRKKNQPRYLREKLKDLEYDKNEIKIWTTK
jgi:hypothetical protein